jgi:intracellular sulfur oxidation DsrE/DsrF family protein
MPLSRQRFLSFAALAAAALVPARGRTADAAVAPGNASSPAARAPDSPASRFVERCVFQVSDADPAKWSLTLGNVMNAQAALGRDGVALEIVAFGPGVDMLKAGSPVAARVAEAQQAGVHVAACQNTMRNRHLVEADMLPAMGYVPSGVVEIMRKQREGWATIRA